MGFMFSNGKLEQQVECPEGTYPPKCFPCLGCEPCNDGTGDFCDTVWSATLEASDVHPLASCAGYQLDNGRLMVGGELCQE